MQLSQEQRGAIENQIAELVIKGLREGLIQEEDLSPIGKFVLEKIDTLQTEEQMVAFLTEMAQKWPLFSNILTIEKGKVSENSENQTAIDVLGLAKEGKIDEAVDLAKSVTAPEVSVVAEVPVAPVIQEVLQVQQPQQ
jgi:hypothetical protein